MPKTQVKEYDDHPLSRIEATLAADFLRQKGKTLKSGWISLWKVRPSEISESYETPVLGLLDAIRRHPVGNQ